MSDGSYNATYDAGINASWNQSWADTLYSAIAWGYNMTLGAITYITESSNNLQTNISAVNTSLMVYINNNITSLNASIQYNYNQSNYILTITNANFTALNASVTKWLYNMSDGSYNDTYDKYAYNMSDRQVDNFNVTNLLNATYVISELINATNVNIFKGNITLAAFANTTTKYANITHGNISRLYVGTENVATSTITTGTVTTLTSTTGRITTAHVITGNFTAINRVIMLNASIVNATLMYINGVLINSSLLYNMSGDYNYNQTDYILTITNTNFTALNASLLAYINSNITNLNASIQYNYNQSNYILTITNANFTALNESVTKWLYNMSDGSYNDTYDKYAYNMSDRQVDNFNVTNQLQSQNGMNVLGDIGMWFKTLASVWAFGYDADSDGSMDTGLYFNITSTHIEYQYLGNVLQYIDLSGSTVSTLDFEALRDLIANRKVLITNSHPEIKFDGDGPRDSSIIYNDTWTNDVTLNGILEVPSLRLKWTDYLYFDQWSISSISLSPISYLTYNTSNRHVFYIGDILAEEIRNNGVDVFVNLTAPNICYSNGTGCSAGGMEYSVANFNVTNNFNATNITTTNISIGSSNIFWNGSNLIIKG